MAKQERTREAGVLLHPTSLPSPYGIGDLGREALEFIDFLEKAGQHIWQVLPLTHTGYGDSPYQGFSAFAGQPLLISLERLWNLKLLSPKDILSCPQTDPEHVDYGTIIPWKMALLRKAYENSEDMHLPNLTAEFYDFEKEAAFWLDDYSLFMALKDVNGGKSWQEWDEYRCPTPAEKKELHKKLRRDVGFYKFIQFFFYRQWKLVKNYAAEHDIQIVGDIPIFVSMDSADVWANQHLFQLDTKGFPLSVAGVPPDYFSETGQLWGNPLYDWEAHEKEGFAWWISRVKHQLKLVDILRIDHFRGFEAYWSIPYGEKTAINGEWIKAPGSKLFSAIQKALGDDLPIIAEDLGIITEEVEALRDEFNFPGMKVLQFAFEGTGESTFLPHNFTTPNCICYTGTHDNDTSRGWHETLAEDCKEKLHSYVRMTEDDSISRLMISTCLSTIAKYAIYPLQDVLNIGKDGRMNTPGVAAGNWSWRYRSGALTDDIAEELHDLTALYGRL